MRGRDTGGFGLAPSAREWLRTPEWQREERGEGREEKRRELEKEKKKRRELLMDWEMPNAQRATNKEG